MTQQLDVKGAGPFVCFPKSPSGLVHVHPSNSFQAPEKNSKGKKKRKKENFSPHNPHVLDEYIPPVVRRFRGGCRLLLSSSESWGMEFCVVQACLQRSFVHCSLSSPRVGIISSVDVLGPSVARHVDSGLRPSSGPWPYPKLEALGI